MNMAQLSRTEQLLPSELRRFGKRVRYFVVNNSKNETLAQAKLRTFGDISTCIQLGGILYTGIHSETDWSCTRWWFKGGHLVNRTLEFAIILPAKVSFKLTGGGCGYPTLEEAQQSEQK